MLLRPKDHTLSGKGMNTVRPRMAIESNVLSALQTGFLGSSNKGDISGDNLKEQKETKSLSAPQVQSEWLCFSAIEIEILHKISFDKRVPLFYKFEIYCFTPTTSLYRRGV